MKIKKIQLTKMGTLSVVYKDNDSNIVSLEGANIVHKDLKEAMRALIPHFALLCEMRETADKSLQELEEQRELTEGGIYKKLAVTGVVLDEDGIRCGLIGRRILQRGDIININSPRLSLSDDDEYPYLSAFSLAVDGIKYEAEQYITGRKWGLAEGNLDFDNVDPFKDGIQAGEVPNVQVEVKETKGNKKAAKRKNEHPAA